MASKDQATENNESSQQFRTYDHVFEHVRSFGSYQRLLYLGIKLLIIPMSSQFTALVFCLGTPMFQCVTPNVTCSPRKCCDNCTSYEFSSLFTTAVSEWNLICDRLYMGASLQMAFFAGMLVGSVVTGIMSDAWGRKICMFACYAIMLVAGVGSCYSDCISLFGLLRFFVGFGLTGTMLSSYVYTMELVGPTRRTIASSLTGGFWAFAGLATLMESYFIREWRLLLLVFTVPAVLFFPFWRLVPESPRWLVLNGRLDDALAVLLKYGGKQGKPIDTDELRHLLGEIRDDQLRKEKASKKYTVIDLVRTRKLRKWSFIMAYQWFTVAFFSFGVYLFLSQLAGNIYLNYAITRAISAASVPVDWLLLVKFGRRGVHASYAIIGGVSLLIVLGVNKEYPLVTTGLTILSTIIGPNWGTIYLITAELYPTVLRNTALGTGSLFGRVGATIAPYFTMIGQLPGLSLDFPVIVFGVCALIAGVLTFILPETVFAEMHQTIDEVERAGDDYSLICCGKQIHKGKSMADGQKDVVTPDETANGIVLTNYSGGQDGQTENAVQNLYERCCAVPL